MAIRFHPGQGVVVLVDYRSGFVPPEMVKRRPAIIICPKIKARKGLCTVLPLSTTAPDTAMGYHAEISLPFELPSPWDAATMWIKGDMVATVSLDRIDLVRIGVTADGKREYLLQPVGDDLLKVAHRCLLNSLGL